MKKNTLNELLKGTKMIDVQSQEYVAKVWKMNDKRNKSSMITPYGISYQEYCTTIRSTGREPLPFDALWEGDFEDEEE